MERILDYELRNFYVDRLFLEQIFFYLHNITHRQQGVSVYKLLA